MAHKKSGGSKARQGNNVSGKRLGVKIFAGQEVKIGQIIVRQKGTQFHSGNGTGLGRDFTIFAQADGTVAMRKRRGKNFIDVTKSESK